MIVNRLALKEGAQAARGAAVIIDVFRAFSCEPLMLHYGASKIYIERDIDKCLELAPDAVLVGERDEVPIPGFDLTNSPFQIMQRGRGLFGGRTVVHRTTSGVAGALAALETADEVLLASFMNARATASYLRRAEPAEVSIVAMGVRSVAPAPEDDACGDYIESLLTGKAYDHVQAVAAILAHETAQKFLRGDKDYLPREDPAICLQRDLFDVVLRAERESGPVRVRPIRSSPVDGKF